ncbi:cyb5r2, partial [Symbiodinium microadriaticum]
NLFGTDSLALANLLSTMQQQAFMLPAGVDASKPFPVQCFGRYLQVILPPFAQPGLVVQLFLNNGQLSAMLSSLYEGRLVNLTEVVVEDCLQIN